LKLTLVLKVIGPYKLLRTLGEGGMGQVWLASRPLRFGGKVALKLIKGGMYDQSVIQRFDSERQSLAINGPPGDAQSFFFDAGTSNGQPYFVMEYVPGVPVTQYCDEKPTHLARAPEALHQDLRRRTTRAPESRHPPGFEAFEHSHL